MRRIGRHARKTRLGEDSRAQPDKCVSLCASVDLNRHVKEPEQVVSE